MAVLKTCRQCGGDFEGSGNKRFCSSACNFWLHVDRRGGMDACWPWTGYVNPRTGYGAVSGGLFGTQRVGAHRVEPLWSWLREDVTDHHGHATAEDLTRRVAAFERKVNADPYAVADRLWVKDQLNPEEEKLRFSK